MRAMLGPLVIVGLLAAVWLVFFRGNPGGISDAQYSEFSRLASPKLLYSCTRKPTEASLLRETRECVMTGRSGCDQKSYESGGAEAQSDVDFVGGGGDSTYDALLHGARMKCGREVGNLAGGTLTVLEAHKS